MPAQICPAAAVLLAGFNVPSRMPVLAPGGPGNFGPSSRLSGLRVPGATVRPLRSEGESYREMLGEWKSAVGGLGASIEPIATQRRRRAAFLHARRPRLGRRRGRPAHGRRRCAADRRRRVRLARHTPDHRTRPRIRCPRGVSEPNISRRRGDAIAITWYAFHKIVVAEARTRARPAGRRCGEPCGASSASAVQILLQRSLRQ